MRDADNGTPLQDPVEKMRELRDAYLEVWSKHLIDTVNSESYAQASGTALNTCLNLVAPFKEPMEQALLRTLRELRIPTSADFSGLAGRITNIEIQLDNIDAKLDSIGKLMAGIHAATGTGTTTKETATAQIPRRPATVRTRAAAPKAAGRRAQKRKK